MSLETSRRVWQARQDPRRQTASIGIYSHVKGIAGDLPRPAYRAQRGARPARPSRALCGMSGSRRRNWRWTRTGIPTSRWPGPAVGLRPVPQAPGAQAAAPVRAARYEGARELAAVCEAGIDTALIEGPLGHPGAPGGIRVERAFQRGDGAGPVWLGSAGRGDPIHGAGVQLGSRCAAFLATSSTPASAELRRVLN